MLLFLKNDKELQSLSIFHNTLQVTVLSVNLGSYNHLFTCFAIETVTPLITTGKDTRASMHVLFEQQNFNH